MIQLRRGSTHFYPILKYENINLLQDKTFQWHIASQALFIEISFIKTIYTFPIFLSLAVFQNDFLPIYFLLYNFQNTNT